MEDLDPLSKTLNLRLTPVLKKLFGHDIIEKIQGVGLRARDVFELVGAQQQCRAVIGPNIGADCWICGIKISKKPERAFYPKSKLKGDNPTLGLTAECEHVLPIAQAVILLELYNSNMKPIMRNPDEKHRYDMLQLEYKWAHVVCNQEKNDMCPILVKADGNFEVNEIQIQNLLENIKGSSRADSKLLKANILKTYGKGNNFINTRGRIVVDQYKRIIDFIQQVDRPENKRFSQLVVFAGIAGLTDRSRINPLLHTIIDSINIDDLGPLGLNLKQSNLVLELYAKTKEYIKMFNEQLTEKLPDWSKYAKLKSYINIKEENAAHHYKNNLFDFIVHLSKNYDELLSESRINYYSEVLGLYIIYRTIKEINAEYVFDDKMKELYKEIEDYTHANLAPEVFNVLDDEYKSFENIEIEYAAGVLKSLIGPKVTKGVSRFNRTGRATRKATRKVLNLGLKRHMIGKTGTRKAQILPNLNKYDLDIRKLVSRSGRSVGSFKLNKSKPPKP